MLFLNNVSTLRIMQKLIYIFIFTLVSFGSYAQVNQYGYPFYKYYGMTDYGGTEQNWALVKDHRGIVYVGNNDDGILEYDGKHWRQISINNNSIVRSLAVDDDGVVYVGAVDEFGKLVPDDKGMLHYQSLLPLVDSSKGENFKDIWKTYVLADTVYYASFNRLFKYFDNKIEVIDLPQYTNFTHLIDDQIYVGQFYDGLLKYDPKAENTEDTTFVTIDSRVINNKNAFVLEKLSDSIVLIGTLDSGLFTMTLPENRVARAPYKEINQYLKENQLYNADLTTQYKAFATLQGGIMVARDFKPYEVYDQKTGLPSDETVSSVYSDSGINTPLWATLNNGIIRVDWHLPFRVMDQRNGLSGHLLDIIRFNHELYVGTSSGLFKLTYDGFNPKFEKIIDHSVWDLQLYTYPYNSKKVLLVGTIRGLHEITENGYNGIIERRIKGIKQERNYYIYKIAIPNPDKPNELAIGTNDNFIILKNEGNSWTRELKKDIDSKVREIGYYDGAYWLGTSFEGIVKYTREDDKIRRYKDEEELGSITQNRIVIDNDNLYALNPAGVFKYDKTTDSFKQDNELGKLAAITNMGVSALKWDEDHYYFSMISDEKQRIRRMSKDGTWSTYDTAIFNRLPNVQYDAIYPEKDVVWFGCSKGLFAYVKDMEKGFANKSFNTLIRKVVLYKDSLIYGGYTSKLAAEKTGQGKKEPISFRYSSNDIEFTFSAPYYEEEDKLLYSYKLEGYDDFWSPWDTKTVEDYNNLPSGEYTFKVRARNIYGFESEPDEMDISFGGDRSTFSFSILPPWYQTIWAIIGYFIVLVFIIRVIVQWRTRKLQQEKERLEEIVRERTAEIMEKKEEIEKQRDEIAEKNQSITDSIHYASRIQQALLPSEKMFSKAVPEHFVLFKPRDIVSGDYYWMTQIKNKTILVAADCTGHGVPGAFMSMLGMSFFNEIVNKNVVTDAGEILNQLRAHVIEALKQEGDDAKAKDGMDLALYVIDKDENMVYYAGANNPLYIIRKQTEEEKKAIAEEDSSKLPKRALYDDTFILEEIKADKMPIGIHIKKKPFETKEVHIKEGMKLYTFSDGYVDQFGGPRRRKFMSKSFKKLLFNIHQKPMQEQKQILDDRIESWIEEGDEIQVDDIVVLGVTVN